MIRRNLTALPNPRAAAYLVGFLAAICCGSGRGAETTMEYDGFIKPVHDVLVAASDIGRLELLQVKLGDSVQAGDVIGQMESSLQRAEVEVARHQAAMRGDLDAALAELEMHQMRLSQLQQLAQHNAARPDELARAETDVKIAEAKVKMARESAELNLLRLRRQEAELNRRTIRAPVAGRIARLYRQPGEYVSPSDPTIVRLVSTDKLIGIFNLPAEDAGLLEHATRVWITPRTLGRSVPAAIDTISPAIDGESGTIQVRVRLDAHQGRVIPGDRCTLSVRTTVPRQAARPAMSQR